jgi:hypothetical protein
MSKPVRLSFPARGDLLILARLVAAAVASRAELGVDDIEDLRLAVDELCLSVMTEGDEKGEVSLELTPSEGSVEISCAYAAPPSSAPVARLPGEPPELSSRILEALVDAHSLSVDGSRRHGWLKKQSTSVPSV